MKSSILFIIVILSTLSSQKGFSWGGAGHTLVCQAAIYLTPNKELKKLLMTRTPAILYLCNLPDTYWKSTKGTESGNSTHFFDPDLVGDTLKDAPESYQEAISKYSGRLNALTQKPIVSVDLNVGSLWWRADQFFRLSLEAAKNIPKGNTPTTDNEMIYKMWVMMGLMGHFVADNGQPIHTSRDYDGWEHDRGGLHGYYETDLVNELPSSTLGDILKQVDKVKKEFMMPLNQNSENSNKKSTKTNQNQLSSQLSVIEWMRKLSLLSQSDLPKLLELDQPIKKSIIKMEHGMELKTPAERRPASEVIEKFRPMILTQMARSAYLLATLWNQVYEEAQSPRLDLDKSFLFPHKFDFVPPDYTK